jgi:hypothetical protein
MLGTHYNFSGVARWLRAVKDLQNLDAVLMPLHVDGNHWVCSSC